MKTLISLASLAVLLCACATPNVPTAETTPVAAQNATYVVGENPPVKKMPATASGDDLSVVKRVYWYFAGR